ncbi:conserved Plasmodium protein, unknown function [Plasmodium yoelii]|uniref:Uncharacterized protein n=3 Tax=Plasmodium yoelii TaxID=5861 RepID=A0AAE9X137_PLAYO|nr:conserved Plasmodium protein, unknown function [Plasmodium yoelii]WBY60139.1 hypothetical protein Py17XNL_001303282 [Plasmodium yoelii yoelii]CDU20046.1 conserved Plasmodium protein, unknown function [Plasmodium yoelii]VTZ80804.1 conserved Plasmodium protein, unknown function [Plasmodium yoelii]|eukprot:XP_725073.2 conserved Plasmodium protein, unknown function [Plasmodium yoelii]
MEYLSKFYIKDMRKEKENVYYDEEIVKKVKLKNCCKRWSNDMNNENDFINYKNEIDKNSFLKVLERIWKHFFNKEKKGQLIYHENDTNLDTLPNFLIIDTVTNTEPNILQNNSNKDNNLIIDVNEDDQNYILNETLNIIESENSINTSIDSISDYEKSCSNPPILLTDIYTRVKVTKENLCTTTCIRIGITSAIETNNSSYSENNLSSYIEDDSIENDSNSTIKPSMRLFDNKKDDNFYNNTLDKNIEIKTKIYKNNSLNKKRINIYHKHDDTYKFYDKEIDDFLILPEIIMDNYDEENDKQNQIYNNSPNFSNLIIVDKEMTNIDTENDSDINNTNVTTFSQLDIKNENSNSTITMEKTKNRQ